MKHSKQRHDPATSPLRKAKKWKTILTIVTLCLPFLYVGFVVADHFGFWDALEGLDSVQIVADRFELSYAENASEPVRPGDDAWGPLLRLIYRYSRAKFPQDKMPRVVARLAAPLSVKTPETGPVASEWTVPSTPLLLIYKEWPGNTVDPEDYRVIGSIGDLQDWISKEKDRRKFLVLDIFLGLFGPMLAVLIFVLERRIAPSTA
ncbi:MAG: hypothetical protein WBS17_09125 [Candidatus Acidiferrales bacterium]